MRHLVTIPAIWEYEQLLGSPEFREMEQYSDSFLKANSQALTPYRRKWTHDPFHQWSRQWEYPYVFNQITGFVSPAGVSRINVLDAGSGVTFFPYFVKSQIPGSSVECVDNDKRLVPIFDQVNRDWSAKVNFVVGDISSLPFEDASFDIIYSISVLEHTGNYASVVREFRRLLRGGGVLIITFDISVDGARDMRASDAQQLIEELRRTFPCDDNGSFNVSQAITRPDILTTKAISRRNKELLPWRNPVVATISTIYRRHLPRQFGYPNLTCLGYACVGA